MHRTGYSISWYRGNGEYEFFWKGIVYIKVLHYTQIRKIKGKMSFLGFEVIMPLSVLLSLLHLHIDTVQVSVQHSP